MSYIAVDPPNSFTASNLLSLLHSVVSKWKKLGEVLGIDKDNIDKIDSSNEFDEVCLNEMLERFVIVHHNWKDIVTALRKLEEQQLADRIEKSFSIELAIIGASPT